MSMRFSQTTMKQSRIKPNGRYALEGVQKEGKADFRHKPCYEDAQCHKHSKRDFSKLVKHCLWWKFKVIYREANHTVCIYRIKVLGSYLNTGHVYRVCAQPHTRVFITDFRNEDSSKAITGTCSLEAKAWWIKHLKELNSTCSLKNFLPMFCGQCHHFILLLRLGA